MLSDIKIYEVGPRDGLQNLKKRFSTSEKVHFIGLLAKSGLNSIEIGSFVNPRFVPTMADSEAVFREVLPFFDEKMEFGALIPNEKGLKRAISAGATYFNAFFSPSDEFNQRNLGKSRIEAVEMLQTAFLGIPKENIRVYVSCAFGCPFEGPISDDKLIACVQEAASIGGTVVLCDTVGSVYPALLRHVLNICGYIPENLALHLHEGPKGRTGLFENVKIAYDFGICEFDSSIGGLGGCPFMPNTGGNLATEDLVEWAESNNIDCNIKLTDLEAPLNFLNGIIGGLLV